MMLWCRKMYFAPCYTLLMPHLPAVSCYIFKYPSKTLCKQQSINFAQLYVKKLSRGGSMQHLILLAEFLIQPVQINIFFTYLYFCFFCRLNICTRNAQNYNLSTSIPSNASHPIPLLARPNGRQHSNKKSNGVEDQFV